LSNTNINANEKKSSRRNIVLLIGEDLNGMAEAKKRRRKVVNPMTLSITKREKISYLLRRPARKYLIPLTPSTNSDGKRI
jgi:hypothetical protein